MNPKEIKEEIKKEMNKEAHYLTEEDYTAIAESILKLKQEKEKEKLIIRVYVLLGFIFVFFSMAIHDYLKESLYEALFQLGISMCLMIKLIFCVVNGFEYLVDDFLKLRKKLILKKGTKG